MKVHINLYVKNQKQSAAFYSKVLKHVPTLDVPGMTEVNINEE